MDIELVIAFFVLAITVLIIFRSHKSGHYGRLKPSEGVTDTYNNFRVNPEMNYYISGSDACPNAIIGIYKKWTLASDLWKPKAVELQGMKDLVTSMQDKALDRNLMLHGFNVVDHEGKKIGDWLSVMGPSITVKIKDEQLFLETPPQDIYQR